MIIVLMRIKPIKEETNATQNRIKLCQMRQNELENAMTWLNAENIDLVSKLDEMKHKKEEK